MTSDPDLDPDRDPSDPWMRPRIDMLEGVRDPRQQTCTDVVSTHVRTQGQRAHRRAYTCTCTYGVPYCITRTTCSIPQIPRPTIWVMTRRWMDPWIVGWINGMSLDTTSNRWLALQRSAVTPTAAGGYPRPAQASQEGHRGHAGVLTYYDTSSRTTGPRTRPMA